MGDILASLDKDETFPLVDKTDAILKSVIESPQDIVIFALDRQYRYLAFNSNHLQTMKKIWGADIVIGNCMLDYITSPDDCTKAKENFDWALSGKSFTLEEEYGNSAMERRYYENNYSPVIDGNNDIIGLTLFLTDITDRKKMEFEREQLIKKLQDSLAKVKTLSGLLPVCSHCKKIRDDTGYWQQIEAYIKDNSDAEFTHSVCPECAEKFYSIILKK